MNHCRLKNAALQFRSACGVGRLRDRACKILMEIRIWRDGLDHILSAAEPLEAVAAAAGLAIVRTASHMGPKRPDLGRLRAQTAGFALAAGHLYDAALDAVHKNLG